jgi:hypothetical protein
MFRTHPVRQRKSTFTNDINAHKAGTLAALSWSMMHILRLTSCLTLTLIAAALPACDGALYHETHARTESPTPRADGGNTPPMTNDDPPNRVPPGMRDMPCDVQEVLATKCATCHSDPTFGGAPMPLTSIEHFTGTLSSGASVADAVIDRIQDEARPMPPVTQDPLTDDEKRIIIDWIEDGQPSRPAGEICDEITVPDLTDGVGPDSLGCEVTHEFLAGNAAAATPYDIPHQGADPNSYVCFPIANPFAAGTQATAWAPVIDNGEVLHHWILWGSNETPRSHDPMPCDVLPTRDAEFVTGWAPGGQNVVLPDDVGLDLQYRTFYLQFHYWNPSRTPGLTDRSGVAFCSTPTPRTHAAGVVTLGDAGIRLPPRSRDVDVTHQCRPFQMPGGGDFTILSSGPHMHQLATSFLSEVIRADGSRQDLGRIDAWNFDDQTSIAMEPPVRVNRGDSLRINCRYNNPTDRFVGFGENSEDEMCFDFLLVYPVDHMPVGQRKCIGIF